MVVFNCVGGVFSFGNISVGVRLAFYRRCGWSCGRYGGHLDGRMEVKSVIDTSFDSQYMLVEFASFIIRGVRAIA